VEHSPEQEYKQQIKLPELQLESLVIPEVNVAEQTGKLILNLTHLWANANASVTCPQ
jgi:hypothetical protein